MYLSYSFLWFIYTPPTSLLYSTSTASFSDTFVPTIVIFVKGGFFEEFDGLGCCCEAFIIIECGCWCDVYMEGCSPKVDIFASIDGQRQRNLKRKNGGFPST